VNFGDAAYSEGLHAQRIAEHLGTEHAQVDVGEEELLDVVKRLPRIYDEPFADSSQVPMVLVSRAARRHVTVALTGDGGDELFGGYNRYYWPDRIRRRVQFLPPAMRVGLGRAVGVMSRHVPSAALSLIGRVLLSGGPVQDLRGKLRKAGQVLSSRDSMSLYAELISYWPDPRALVPAWNGLDEGLRRLSTYMEEEGDFGGQTRWDLENYLPGDNLVKVDRASMSVALELRAPLLDHRVCELARGMIGQFGVGLFDANPKWPLKQVLARHVPMSLTERPKMGFSVPLARWLREGLKEWGQRLVADTGRLAGGVLDEATMTDTWVRHQSGKVDLSAQLWPALMLLAWLAEREVESANST
jgi:asparagine synthase (glutamine-hydrolysing)